MKITSKVILFSILFCTGCTSMYAQYIKLNGKQFIDGDGQPFFPMLMNYAIDFQRSSYPASIINSFPNRTSSIGLDGKFHGLNVTTAHNNIVQDFTEIKNIGFNTVRIIMKPIKLPNQKGFYIQTKDNDGQNHDASDPNTIILIQPDANGHYVRSTNPALNFYLTKLQEVFDIARQTGVKVIIPCGEDTPDLILDNAGQPQTEDYREFLEMLSSFVNQLPANISKVLMAYEFIGEPTYKNTIHLKKNICDIGNVWMQAIKKNDVNHLTTVGAVYLDDGRKNGWDPLFLNVDFVNVHIYPDFPLWEYQQFPSTFRQRAINRFNDMIYNFDLIYKKPYIIGETAFIGVNQNGNGNLRFPLAVQGDEADQDYFIQQTFPFILRKSRASGYGWWDFGDAHYVELPPQPPSVPPKTMGYYSANFYGIMRRGDPSTSSGWTPLRKQVAQTFINYSINPPNYSGSYGPSSPVFDPNDHYYNPYLFPVNNTYIKDSKGVEHFGKVTGTVKDQFGNPIRGAVILGAWIDGKIGTEDHLGTNITFTDNNGYFEIYAYDTDPGTTSYPDNPLLDKTFSDIKVYAFGSVLDIERGWSSPPIQTHENFVLPSLQTKFDNLLTASIQVPIGSTQNFQGYSTLTTLTFKVDGDNAFSGGHSELVARNEITLSPGFDAIRGSEVRVYNTPLAIDCNDISSLNELPKPTDITTPDEKKSSGFFTVYPNPTMGIFTVDVSPINNASYKIEVYNIYGQLVKSIDPQGRSNSNIQIDLTNESSGVYLIKIIAGQVIETKKIVVDRE